MCLSEFFFFFKQKTAYEMRISDWSSDVCSSDLKDTPDGGFAPLSDRETAAKPGYDPRLLMDNLPVIDELVEAMNEMGWGVYSFDHEDANGQFETDFKYADALTMADRFVFFRMMANEIARKHGAFATFMPKPSAQRTGSGEHYHMHLSDLAYGKNLFEVAGEDTHSYCS